MNDNTTINNDIKDTSAKLLKEEKEERSPARKREIIKLYSSYSWQDF